jgi:hypothetical protein
MQWLSQCSMVMLPPMRHAAAPSPLGSCGCCGSLSCDRQVFGEVDKGWLDRHVREHLAGSLDENPRAAKLNDDEALGGFLLAERGRELDQVAGGELLFHVGYCSTERLALQEVFV